MPWSRPLHLSIPAALLVAGVACQVPFGADRHDLEGDRIVAVLAEADGPELRVGLALVSEGRPWLDAAPTVGWHWLDDDDPRVLAALDPDDPGVADGVAPRLARPEAPARLGVVVGFPSGAVRRAFLDLEPDVAPPALDALEFEPRGPWAGGDAVTITARTDGDPLVRWMTVGGRGTFLEQSRQVTRWDAARVERDEGEVVSSEPIEPGPVTFVALALDQAGGNAIRVEEDFVGEPPPGLWTPSGRWIGVDALPSDEGPWEATVRLDDDAPTGLRLEGLAPAVGEPPVLDCDGPNEGLLDPTWLLHGWCLRPALDGATVWVEAR